jgi:3-hydroxyisobutyrate dehydrogenase-like beta-hydroxyacid dehydrogenase
MQANRQKIHRIERVAFIGCGEAGGILGGELVRQGCAVSAYDLLYDSATTRADLEAKGAALNVRVADSLAAAIRDAELIVSAVTASAAKDVATLAAKFITPNQWFLDINSVSPETKCEDARVIQSAGAKYVEAAVMAPVPPQRLKVPMLLGGPHASELAEMLRSLGMDANAVAEKVGVASAIKMCRSVMIKGLEALTVECLFAARRYEAEESVLASLHATFPNMGWTGTLPDYLISRVAEHGRRRAAEMREVTLTLQDVGLMPTMAAATARLHDALVDSMQARNVGWDSEKQFSWRELADKLDSIPVLRD